MASKKYKELDQSEHAWLVQMLFNTDVPMLSRRDRVMAKFGIVERTVWKWRKAVKDELTKNSNPYVIASTERRPTPGKHYIVTWAQNATPIHQEFWSNLRAYAEYIGAEIHVIPGRYRNPSLLVEQNRLQSQEWWDDELTDYLNANRQELVPGVVMIGDVKIQPTATDPMRSFEGLVGDKSAIFGHPKVQLQSMPSLPGHPTPVHATSLACTVRNYSDTKAGKKGEHQHAIGFTLVENAGDMHHIRQVVAAKDGSFSDVYFHAQDGAISLLEETSAFVMGDIHLKQVEQGVVDSCVAYMDKVRPTNVVLHDIMDGISVNHHEAKNPFAAAKRLADGNHIIAEEVEEVVRFVEELDRFHPVLVFSNHCEWLDKHLIEADWKKDIANAATYLELAARKLRIGHDKGVLHDIVDERSGDNVTTLGPNDSFRINDWETAAHGHLGVNGARGAMRSFRRFNTKIIFGHFHSVARYGNAVQVGTFTKANMGYNKGPSSWAHAGAVIHVDGSVQQFIFKQTKEGDYVFTSLSPTSNRA